MLAPMPRREKGEKDSTREEEAEAVEELDEAEDKGCLHLNLVHNRRWLHVLYLDYVNLSIRPLRLQIEQNTTARLIRLAHVFEVGTLPFSISIDAHADTVASKQCAQPATRDFPLMRLLNPPFAAAPAARRGD